MVDVSFVNQLVLDPWASGVVWVPLGLLVLSGTEKMVHLETAVWLSLYRLLLRRSKFRAQRAREEGRPMLFRLTGAATLSRV